MRQLVAVAMVAAVCGFLWTYMNRDHRDVLEVAEAGAGVGAGDGGTAHLVLAKAIQDYYEEYDLYPVPEARSGQDTDAEPLRSGRKFMSVLLGLDKDRNPRKRAFFDGRDAGPDRRSGIIYERSRRRGGRLVDAHGQEFYVVIDGDYNGKVRDPDPAGGSRLLDVPVLVYSSGKDRDPETWADNLKSW